MGETSIGVPIYCKDYGGKATVHARFMAKDKELCAANITIPEDWNDNGIADQWEREKAREYYQVVLDFPPGPVSDTIALNLFTPDQDSERPTPVFRNRNPKDNPPATLPATLAPAYPLGDGIPCFYEYRGVIVDGGGFDENGKNGKQGHVRLSPVLREVLIFVDGVAGTAKTAGGVAAIRAQMDIVAKSFSQLRYGAELQAYYAVNRLNSPKADLKLFNNAFQTPEGARRAMTQYNTLFSRNIKEGTKTIPFQRYWRHVELSPKIPTLVFLAQNEPILRPGVLSGYANFTELPYNQRCGTWIFPEDIGVIFNKNLLPMLDRKKAEERAVTFETVLAGVIVHELGHQLCSDVGHYPDSNGNGTPNEPPPLKAGQEAGDFETVQFDYTQQPAPAGYRYQTIGA